MTQAHPRALVVLLALNVVALSACSRGSPASAEKRGHELGQLTQALTASVRRLPREGLGAATGSVKAVGADPNGFLVIWGDSAQSFASRLDLHGAPTAAPRVLGVPVDPYDSSLTWAGSHYLLIDGRHLTTRLSAEGEPLGDTQGLATNWGGAQAVCGDARCLAAFIDDDLNPFDVVGNDLRVVWISDDDTRTLPIVLAETPSAFAVTELGGHPLVVASLPDGIWSFLFDETDQPQRTRLTTSPPQSQLAVARVGAGVVIASRDEDLAGDTSLFVFDGSLQLVSQGQVPRPDEATAMIDSTILGLCAEAEEVTLLVTLQPEGQSKRFTYRQTLDTTGAPVGAPTQLGSGSFSLSRVGCGAETFLLAEKSFASGLLIAHGSDGQSGLVSQGPRSQRGAVLAHGSAGTLITWIDNRAGPSTTYGDHVLARLVDGSGEPVSDEILVADLPGVSEIRAAFDGEVFLVAWRAASQASGPKPRVLAVRLDAQGKVLDADPLVLAPESAGFALTALAGGGFIVGLYGSGGESAKVVAVPRSGDPPLPHAIAANGEIVLAPSGAGAYVASFASDFSIAGLALDSSGDPIGQPATLAKPAYVAPRAATAQGSDVVILYSDLTSSRLLRVGSGGVSGSATVTTGATALASNDAGVRSAFVSLRAIGSLLLACGAQATREVRIEAPSEVRGAAIAATGASTWLLAMMAGDAQSPGEILLTSIDDESVVDACASPQGITITAPAGDADAGVEDAGAGIEGDAGGPSGPLAVEQLDLGSRIGNWVVAGGERGYLVAACDGEELLTTPISLNASATEKPRGLAPAALPGETCVTLVDLLWTGKDYLALYFRAGGLFSVRLDENGRAASPGSEVAGGFDETGLSLSLPHIAAISDGEQALVTFQTSVPDTEEVVFEAVRIDLASNAILDSPPLAIGRSPFSYVEDDVGSIAVAGDRRGFVVAYTVSPTPSVDYRWEVFLRAISRDGAMTEPVRVVSEESIQGGIFGLHPFGERYLLSWGESTDLGKSAVLSPSFIPEDLSPYAFDGWILANDEAHGALLKQGSGCARVWPSLRRLQGEGTIPNVGGYGLDVGNYGAVASSAGYLVYWLDPDLQIASTTLTLRRLTFDPVPLGTPCVFDASCTSGYCVDGVCCDGACGDGSQRDCQGCSKSTGAASDGTCSTMSASNAPLHVCRPAAGPCDVPDVCAAGAVKCPANAYRESGTVCGASKGPCDEIDRCAGTSSACIDRLRPEGWVCGDRAIRGVCDLADTCDGVSTACADRVRDAKALCRPAADACDQPERCNGEYSCGPDVRMSAEECASSASDGGVDASTPGEGGERPATAHGDPAHDDPGEPTRSHRAIGGCSAAGEPSHSHFLLFFLGLVLLRRRRGSTASAA